LPHLVYCKEGATDSRREAKLKNPIEASVPAVFETSDRDLDRKTMAILTRSTMKIFRAHNRREDFSHSRFIAIRKLLITLIKNYCSICASRPKRRSVTFYKKKRLHSLGYNDEFPELFFVHRLFSITIVNPSPGIGKEDKGVKTDTMTFDLEVRPQTMKP